VKLIRPIDIKQLNKIQSILPKVIKILAVAPDVKNNLSKYKLIEKHFFLATGHTDANYAQAIQSFDLGAKRVVHLYNALPNFDKRIPTIINAIFNRTDLNCELICDEGHIHPHVILNSYKILGANQLVVISDSLLTKGLKNGQYEVWGIKLDKRGALDFLHDTNSIAGGNLPYNQQIENFGKITKCSMIDILKVSSLNAAKSVRQHQHFGNLIVGAESNFVLLDQNYKLHTTFINGKPI
jgi:N-acetylglucosamine-6-phosphate deacetylase